MDLRFEFDQLNGDVNTPGEHLAEFINRLMLVVQFIKRLMMVVQFIKRLMLVVQFRHIDQCW